MAKLFSFLIICMALVPFSAKAAVGDTYLCLSSQYVEIKEDGEINRYRPIKFEFQWGSPADSSEQIIWFLNHPELIVSKTLFLVEEPPEYEDVEDIFSFRQHSKSSISQTGGLFSYGKLYLTYSSSVVSTSITSLIANCEKTLG
jgi:hypothetical protein